MIFIVQYVMGIMAMVQGLLQSLVLIHEIFLILPIRVLIWNLLHPGQMDNFTMR